MYVLNPSTGELLTLPESNRSVRWPSSCIPRDTVGLGLDLSTNTYKVVRFFHYPPDKARMGMEICTPYPISEWQTATIFFKGSLFWILEEELVLMEAPESPLLRLCLKDEVFSFVMPPTCPALDDDECVLSELDGELCLTQFDCLRRMVI
jgi:hypothetical protein